MRVAFAAALLAGVVVFGVGSAQAAPGDLDPTFGTGGKVLTNFGNDDEKIFALLQQPGASLLAAGYLEDSGLLTFGLARYLSNGTLDPSFGTAGSVRVGFGPGTGSTAYDVVRTPGQKLVVAGIANNQFGVARLLLNGHLDTTFSGDGKTTTTFGPGTSNAWAFSVRVQPDGKIVAAGRVLVKAPKNADFALVRYRANGSLDPTFGSGGKVVTSLTPLDDGVNALLRQPDGKFVVVGNAGNDYQTTGDFGLARYLSNGTLDSSFGVGGKVVTSFGARSGAQDAALQADGKIVAVGGSAGGFALARYTPSGALDPSFGSGGKLVSSFGGDASATSVAIDADGKIVVAGTLRSTTKTFFLVARYTSSGQLDKTFTQSGVVRTAFGSGNTGGVALALQGPKIVLGGYYAAEGWSFDFALARFQGGSLPPPPAPRPSPVTTTTSTTTAAKPAFSIGDVRVTEGTRVRTYAALTVTLSSPAPESGASVHYATRDGTALAGADYAATSGTLELAKGETSARITVPIVPDATHEDSEQFYVRLSDPENATIADGKATVTIIDDD